MIWFSGTGATKQGISISADNIQIKELYDDGYKLDASITIDVDNLEFNDKLKVEKNIVVEGNVVYDLATDIVVDVTDLAKDVVISGSDVSITHDGQTYNIKGTDSTVDLDGIKTFSDSLTVNKDIKTSSKDQKWKLIFLFLWGEDVWSCQLTILEPVNCKSGCWFKLSCIHSNHFFISD